MNAVINNKKPNGSDDAVKLTTFTGAKLDWLRCVAFDGELPPYAFKVAFVIAMHLNVRTGNAMLSDQTIADESGGTARNVRRARVRLRDARWLIWHGTATANVYRPDYGRMNATLDAMLVAKEARREKRQAEQPWLAEGISRATWYRRVRQNGARDVRMRRLMRTRSAAAGGHSAPPNTLVNTLKEGLCQEEETQKGGRS